MISINNSGDFMTEVSNLICFLTKKVFLILCIVSSIAYAQNFPEKPLRIIVGPGPDSLARITGEKITEDWGQAVIVEARPAAGGIVAGDSVAKSTPDGYTLLLSTGSFTINSVLQPKMPYDFQNDLAPVSLLATLPFILVVNTTSPIKSLKELVATTKAQPSKFNYASSGNGTPAHLAGEMLKQMASIDILHIPYKSAAAGVTDLLGGQVNFMFVPAPSALPFIRSNQLRALAVSSPKRYSVLPDIPTVAEEGYPNFAIVGWNGVHVPAKTPKNIIEKLNKEFIKVMHQKDVQAKAIAAGFEPMGSSIEEFSQFVKSDISRSSEVIKTGNIQPF
jgi:tripartite-type tricarboxylate transporter receptor subunit TctC